MPDRKNYRLDYRPKNYWSDPVQMLLANIKGEHRRKGILKWFRGKGIEAVPKPLIAERLPDALRESLGALHPKFMGGEYLPDSRDGEVEIARLSLKSTTSDVISIRATRQNGHIRYRIADEYENVFACTPETSEEPLTFGELIGLIDSAEIVGSGYPPGLADVYRDSNLEEGLPFEERSQRAQELMDFVTVTSVFYPELEQWYCDEAQEWLESHTKPDHE